MAERKRKKKHVGGKKKRKKDLCICNPETRTLALHAFPAFQACMCVERYALLYCGVREVIKA